MWLTPFPGGHGDRPGLQAQPPLLHIQPPCYRGNKGQQGGMGMGQSTGLGQGSGCQGEAKEPAPCLLLVFVLSPCPCPSLCGSESRSLSVSVSLTLVFSLSHVSLTKSLTFPHLPPIHQAHSLPLVYDPHTTPISGEDTHILRKLQGQTLLLSAPSVFSRESLEVFS